MFKGKNSILILISILFCVFIFTACSEKEGAVTDASV